MTKHSPFTQITIKIHLILLLITLSACNSSSTEMANGLGGTGITTGRISAFGSLYVNGIEFNTDNASFERDRVKSKTQDDFSIGEIVKIIGSIDPNKKTGTATKVIFSNVVEGSVTKITSGNELEILGQTVRTDKLTLLHGFDQLSDLQLGNIIEVSGFVTQQGIIASSIKLIAESFNANSHLEVEGYITSLDTSAKTFKLNQLIIDYSQAQFKEITEGELKEGLYLIISTEQDISNNTLQASSILLLNDLLEEGVYYEIEGYITKFDSPTHFKIDIDAVEVNADTVFINGTQKDLSLDSRLIVKGTVNKQNTLVATEIKLFDSAQDVIVEANIETIDLSTKSFNILGQKIYIDDYTLLSDDTKEEFVFLDLNQFTVGETVLTSIYKDKGLLIADRLSKIATDNRVYLSGIITTIDESYNSISLFGNTFYTNNDTLYLDKEDNYLSKSAYFSRLKEGKTLVEIVAEKTTNGQMIATELVIVRPSTTPQLKTEGLES